MNNRAHFREYNPDQSYLLPPSLREWLPDGHLAYFVMDVVRELDLGEIYNKYDGSRGGHPPYNPHMMVSLLIYSYCVGLVSSRKIERATHETVPFRILAADQHPDHDTIAEFRKRHLKDLGGLFVQILRLCQRAGLVKMGHVALDGTKIRANASKHKAMSYERMEKSAAELEAEVKRLLEEAQRIDDEEDERHGKGRRGDELPEELRFKESRLRKIREAKRALEKEAKQSAENKRTEYEAKMDAWKKRNGRGRPPKAPSDLPSPKSQKNFTDPDSRIMKDGATKSFEQSYNAQAVVDQEDQIIVACHVTQAAVDRNELKPAVEAMKGAALELKPRKFSADAGFWSADNAACLEEEEIDGYIATSKEKHSRKAASSPRGRIPKTATKTERMARKLRTIKGRCTYALRKQIVEPVFGQIKEVRGFRRFSLRGFENVGGEWNLVCMTHNLLKLFRSGAAFATT